MMYKIASLSLALFMVIVRGELSPSEPYDRTVTLMPGNIKLYWKFDDKQITFEVHGPTTGWIGIGFSPNGAMKGSDIFVGWVKNNQVKVTDRHGVGSMYPPLDPEQDINVLGGAECDGWTMFKFSRQLAACEVEYDREITQNTHRFIWAWYDDDPSGDDVNPYQYHGDNKGVESMFFFHSADKPSDLLEGQAYSTFEIRMDEFEIPAEDTYYNCMIIRLPKLSKKHHILKYEPVIQKGNELHVHHMLVSQCIGEMDLSVVGKNRKCFQRNLAEEEGCSTLIAEWAIGAGATIFPEEAGFSIGADDDPLYVAIEMHYDNPSLKSGVIDSSGLRFTYSENLRKYDMGVLSMGALVDGTEHLIPPGIDDFLTVGYCSEKCFESRMTEARVDEIKVFGVALHSHLAGKALKLRHFRGNEELPYPAYDDHYDFNYQEGRLVAPPMVVKKTDRLQLDCICNTEKRTNITVGGFGTRDEMCLAFLYYYPKIDLGHCFSSVHKGYAWGFFGIDWRTVKRIGEDPTTLTSWQLPDEISKVPRTMWDHISSVKWNRPYAKAFEAYYNSVMHYEVCMPRNISEIEINFYGAPRAKLTYVAPRQVCDTSATKSQTMAASGCPAL